MVGGIVVRGSFGARVKKCLVWTQSKGSGAKLLGGVICEGGRSTGSCRAQRPPSSAESGEARLADLLFPKLGRRFIVNWTNL